MMRRLLAVVALAACGDDGVHHLADGGADGSTPIDAPPATDKVSVTVTLSNNPDPGVTVYFVEPDGATQTVLTDAKGVASAAVPAGTSLTVIDQTVAGLTQFDGQVYSILDVVPGDAFQLDLFPQPGTDQFAVNLTVPDDPAAKAFILDPTGCDGHFVNPGTASFVQDTCLGATHDFLLLATDAMSAFSTPLGSILLTDQTLTDGSDLTFTGPYDPPSTTTFEIDNLRPVSPDASITKSLVTPHGLIYSTTSRVTAANHTITTSMDYVANDGVAAYTQVVETSYFEDLASDMRVIQWGPASDTYTFDVGPAALAQIATAPQVDAATGRVTWTEATTGGEPTADGVVTSFRILRDSTSSGWTWFVTAPRVQDPAIQLPALPTDLFDFNVHADDLVTFNQLEITKLTGGYRAFAKLHPWRDGAIALPPAAVPGTSGIAVSSVFDGE